MLSIGQMHEWEHKISATHIEKLNTNIEPIQSHDSENIFYKLKNEDDSFILLSEWFLKANIIKATESSE